MEILAVLACIALVGLSFLLLSIGHDLCKRSLQKNIARHGGKLIEAVHDPFGKIGWLVPPGGASYEVTYIDKDGRRHKAKAKAYWFFVYWVEDKLT